MGVYLGMYVCLIVGVNTVGLESLMMCFNWDLPGTCMLYIGM